MAPDLEFDTYAVEGDCFVVFGVESRLRLVVYENQDDPWASSWGARR